MDIGWTNTDMRLFNVPWLIKTNTFYSTGHIQGQTLHDPEGSVK